MASVKHTGFVSTAADLADCQDAKELGDTSALQGPTAIDFNVAPTIVDSNPVAAQTPEALSHRKMKKYRAHFFTLESKLPETSHLDLASVMELPFLEFAKSLDDLNKPYIISQKLVEEAYANLLRGKLEEFYKQYATEPHDREQNAEIVDMWIENVSRPCTAVSKVFT